MLSITELQKYYFVQKYHKQKYPFHDRHSVQLCKCPGLFWKTVKCIKVTYLLG